MIAIRCLARYWPFAQVGGWLAVTFLAFNIGLRALDATACLGWLPKAVSGAGFLEDNRQRVAAACDRYREGAVPATDYLCVITGLSNVREAFDLQAMKRHSSKPHRYLALGAAGIGMGGVVQQAGLVLSSELQPDLVVVGIGLHQLVDARVGVRDKANESLWEYLRRGDLRNAATAVRNWIWCYDRRKDVGNSAEVACLELRAGLFRRFNVSLRTEADERRSPWREMVRSGMPDHFSDATLREEIEFFDGLGVFDKGSYEGSPKALASLVRMVQEFQAKGSKVVILLLPENSRLRERIPQGVADILCERLRQEFGELFPAILDYRDALEDSGFVDLGHLNEEGRRRFSALIAEPIEDQLPTGAPLMSLKGNASPQRSSADARWGRDGSLGGEAVRPFGMARVNSERVGS